MKLTSMKIDQYSLIKQSVETAIEHSNALFAPISLSQYSLIGQSFSSI